MLKEIKLTGEQKKVLFLPGQNPIQIKGVAGSGKTTISLYRAKQLIETQNQLFSNTSVVIFTFNKTLSAYINAVKKNIRSIFSVEGDERKTTNGLDIEVTNFHKWAYSFIGVKNNQIIQFREQEEIIRTAIVEQRSETPGNSILNKSLEFFKEEISWIKGKMFQSLNEYRSASRSGRGVIDRVSRLHKEAIWGVYERYTKRMHSLNKVDFDDFASLCIERIDNDPYFEAPFSHIVIDEAQDLNKAQILAISKLVSDDTKSLTIIADAAQRIYKSGFTWSEVGINVRGGRSISLRKNYRNSVYIAKAASSLLEHEDDKSDFTDIDLQNLREGNKPIVIESFDGSAISEWLSTKVRGLKNYSNTAVLHRTHQGLKSYSDYLTSKGIKNEVIRGAKEIDYTNNAVKVCTMSSIKGLEFDNVFIVDLNDDMLPYYQGFTEENDDFHISTERRLLYTCMTRARDNLFMLTSGKPSRYIEEINPDYLDKQRL